MAKVQIRIYNNFTNSMEVKVEVQEMEGYTKLFNENVSRDNLESVISELKSKYPTYELCEFMI